MRISDWSSDVCSSDLPRAGRRHRSADGGTALATGTEPLLLSRRSCGIRLGATVAAPARPRTVLDALGLPPDRYDGPGRRHRAAQSVRPVSAAAADAARFRSEEHTSELQSLMRLSYAVFCLKKKKHTN